jgi:hypothetical protein
MTDYDTTIAINILGSTSRNADHNTRSTAMYTMQEALAREHLRDLQRSARRSALSRELASATRWHRLERRSRAASQRHAQRAHRVAQVSAVAD